MVAKSLFILFAVFGAAGLGHAQTSKAKTAPAPSPADAAPAANPGWVARCTSASRDAPLECAMEQTAVLSKTGQLVVLVNIRIPGDTRAPVALIQLPLGLNLPMGARLQVDEGKTVDVPVQTCEARGCYINTPVGADILAALKSGKQLKVSFQNLSKETITIPMPLADFATVYEKIK
ncbi:invasion associated locus B family protein [Bradyrhizobium sp. LTSP885]|uniref:invasion associated locus B family protein n=1 Tax=Bradyrhizobium sp. LTSP885 TaxID=1619232 RepID=UPI001FD991A5|nr:invasion associated locus B family protein [Bradyrhizobium sp. LTSP885]